VIKEYRTSNKTFIDVTAEDCWNESIAINLRYVSSARQYDIRTDDPRFTLVTLVGQAAGVVINEEYSRFLRDWHSVRR
jgi:hypothetical protein